MTKLLNILVTGCGGDIGLSVGKILRDIDFIEGLYGCDISDRNAAKFVFNNFFLGLPVGDENHLQNLKKDIEERNIDFIVPVSEHELRLFAKGNVEKSIADKLIMASQKALEIGFDKLKTAEFLKERGLPSPETQKLEDAGKLTGYPVIAKSRTGSGSSKIEIVQNEETLLLMKKTNPEFIIQEYLDGTKGEFTCGLFRSKKGEIRNIIFKRELHGSYSGYGEVVKDKEIEMLLHSMAEELDLIGSINVQLRITSKGPTVFEINPRFSSTVRFRDLMGFKDVEWSIQDKMGLPLSEYSDVPEGKKFYKGFVEYIQ